MHDLSEERIAACLADAFPPPVGRSAHGGELVPVHSSVGVILVDARTGDQPWCALVRGQDHDEVDKALTRHDLRHGMQTGELVLMVVPQARARIDGRTPLPDFVTVSPAAFTPVSPPSGAPPSLRPLREHVWSQGQTADHLASRSTAHHQRRG